MYNNNKYLCVLWIFKKKKTNITKLKRNNDDQFLLPVVKVKR
jgi:hypothetical protein